MTTPPQPQSSPAARPWPVGVPPIPVEGFWIVMSLYNTHGKNEWLGQAFTSREHAWRSMAFTIPSIVMIGDRLDTANAAARALGIVPNGEVK